MYSIYVFMRDNAFSMKTGMLLLDFSAAPCFIQTLQLIIKDTLFSENNINMLIDKARQTVCHFNHSSTLQRTINSKNPAHFKFIRVNAKSLATYARC